MGVKVMANTACSQRCAFCKHWHDPAMTAIRPVLGKTWEYDPKVKKRCLEIGIDKVAMSSCPKFSSKI